MVVFWIVHFFSYLLNLFISNELESMLCEASPRMNIGILGGEDPNVRTEFTLDTHTNVAKKMFPGIVMHHRMSLL